MKGCDVLEPVVALYFVLVTSWAPVSVLMSMPRERVQLKLILILKIDEH